jgi:hypothetical protein
VEQQAKAKKGQTQASEGTRGMSRSGGAGWAPPPAAASSGGGRLAVLASHFSRSSPRSPILMAGEKEAALATEPVDGPTMSAFLYSPNSVTVHSH